jgi:PucR C-terminal helix-turn-helix domain/GGDEF-like domain
VDVARDSHGTLEALVDVAVASDDSRQLIAAAGLGLGRPLGLVSAEGEPLAFTPEGDAGQRALAVARAAARNRFAAPPGWRVVSLVQHSSRLGFLAVGPRGPAGAETGGVLAVLPALLADQLRRAALIRIQRAAFVRRLVGDPPLTPHRARHEAAELGIRLAPVYWPAVLAWRSGAAAPEALERVEREARRLADGSLTALLDGHLALLHPDPDAAPEWFRQVAALARALAPASRAHAIAAAGPAGLGDLSTQVAGLARLHRFGPRSDGDQPLTWARDYALDGLLDGRVEPAAAIDFVERQLGPLIEWDRQHGTDLLGVLEAALDFPRHDRAAQRCFMHRNTFRHRLRHATELLGERMEGADARLAVHVALRLRRLAGGPPSGRRNGAASRSLRA